MINDSRSDIYVHMTTLLRTINPNVYPISKPSALPADAVTNGFIVVTVDPIIDKSQFELNAYAKSRVYIECFIPSSKSQGYVGMIDTPKYKAMQDAVNTLVKAQSDIREGSYFINKDSLLSTDDFYTNGTNSFFVYITSFVLTIK
jgi:hypothetical protein